MEALLEKIIIASRTELCQLFPGFHTAFAYLIPRFGGDLPFGTDGQFLFVNKALLPLYRDDPAAFRHGYLHTLLHCLFLHIAIPEKTDPVLWGIACDIWVEKQIEALQEPRITSQNQERTKFLSLADRSSDPHRLLQLLQTDFFLYTRKEIQRLIAFDDHSLWQKNPPKHIMEVWESLQPGSEGVGGGSRGSRSKGIEEEISLLTSSPYDFRRYLQKYTLPREEIETDTESFDYIYYTLGISQYGNLPLLEPLEYKEVWRLPELVIAMDTSGSCSRELVARFLSEAYSILSRQENFFKKMKVIFFQCDCWLQDTAIIENPEMWLQYADKIKIKGRGGTDFRPVFREVEKLRREGVLKKPRALLYFTDGDGVYPDKPDYETVFVLGGPKKQPHLVPKWAKTLILE